MIEEPKVLTIRRDFRRPTAAQVAAFRGVQTSFVCDAMGGTGAMDSVVAPLLEAHVAGCALVADAGPRDILATFGAIHIMQPGDIIVTATQGCTQVAAAGDQLMGMMRNKGAAGYVTDGAMRDLAGIRAVGLPAWCAGLNPNSPYATGPGRVGAGAVVAGQHVESGDIIVADENGVVVVPHARIDAVIAQLALVMAAEEALEARVKAGYAEMELVTAMLADGRAVEV